MILNPRFRANRLSTIIVAQTNHPTGTSKDQARAASLLSFLAPKVMYFGQDQAPNMDGMRFTKSDGIPSLSQVLGRYAVSIPGYETCALMDASTTFDPHLDELFAYVKKFGLEMAWAAKASVLGDSFPKMFLMSAPVVHHIIGSIGKDIPFTTGWQAEVDAIIKKIMLPHRYVDASAYLNVKEVFEVAKTAPAPILNAYDIPLEKEKQKHGPRKNSVLRRSNKISKASGDRNGEGK